MISTTEESKISNRDIDAWKTLTDDALRRKELLHVAVSVRVVRSGGAEIAC